MSSFSSALVITSAFWLCIRKFADIGNTVQLQYKRHLSSGWAKLVTCHVLPGPGVIQGLAGVCQSGCGCVIVAEMSSEGTLATGQYTKGWGLVGYRLLGRRKWVEIQYPVSFRISFFE